MHTFIYKHMCVDVYIQTSVCICVPSPYAHIYIYMYTYMKVAILYPASPIDGFLKAF